MNEQGTYWGKLASAEFNEVGQNNTPRCQLTFDVRHIQRGQEWEETLAPIIADVSIWLSDKAFEYSAQTLKDLGWNGDMDNPKFARDMYDTGRILVCEHKTYNGQPRENWKFQGQSSSSPISSDNRTALLARWRAMNPKQATPPPAAPVTPQVAAQPPPAPVPPAVQAPSTSPPPAPVQAQADDDLPF